MAKVAEGMARVASEIAAGRLARSVFATEIKVATAGRRSDIESFLKDAKSTRGKAARERADDGQQVVMTRHADIVSMLLGVRTSRREAGSAQAAEAEKMTQELRRETRSTLAGHKASRTSAAQASHKEADETKSRRQTEIKAKLHQYADERDVRQRQRREDAAAQHKDAAAFMKDLTTNVDAFRDKLAKDGRDRAAETRNNLSAYAQDRAEGTAIWTGTAQKSRVGDKRPAPKRSAPEAAPVAVQEAEPASPQAEASESFAVAKSGRHASRNGHGRRGGQAE